MSTAENSLNPKPASSKKLEPLLHDIYFTNQGRGILRPDSECMRLVFWLKHSEADLDKILREPHLVEFK
jgi:hypothetical protein